MENVANAECRWRLLKENAEGGRIKNAEGGRIQNAEQRRKLRY